MLCGNIRTEMAEHETCFLTYFGYTSVIGEDRSGSYSLSRMCLSLIHSFLITFANIAISYCSYAAKTRFFGL